MPAVSKAQQRFMGMVHAADKGETPASPEVAKVSADMKDSDAKDFASTKHDGLPDHVKEQLKSVVREVIREKNGMNEMSGNDVHFKHIMKMYDRGGSFTKKKIGAVVCKDPKASRKDIEEALFDADYRDIIEFEDELGLKEIREKYSAVNEEFKHTIHVDTPTQVVSKPIAAQIMALAKKGVRSNEIGLEMGFVGNAKLAADTFQKVKNKIYFELDKRNESINEDIKSDVNKFLDKLNKEFPDQEYTTDFKGGKYARITHQSRKFGQPSAWGFIAMDDNPSKGFQKGDLLKAAGFNTPAKHARGNILKGDAKYDKYSPTYLKESVNEGSHGMATKLLQSIVSGDSSRAEGTKMSKELAQHYIDWIRTSPFGKKNGNLPLDMLVKASFNWGIERGLDSKLKGELSKLKSTIKEEVNEDVNFRDGKYRFYSKQGVGYLTYDGKVLSSGDFDWEDGSNSYWMYHSSWGGQKAFDTGKDVIAYFKSKKITTESVNEGLSKDAVVRTLTSDKNAYFLTKDGNGWILDITPKAAQQSTFHQKFDVKDLGKGHLGMKYKLSESVNEVSDTAYTIHRMTDAGQNAVQNFIDDNGLDAEKLLKYIKSNPQAKYDVRDYIAGKKGTVGGDSKLRTKFIKMFKESVNEEHDCGCNENHDCGCGGVHEHTHIHEDLSADANGIAGLTASRASAVKDFLEKNNINSNKLYLFLKKGNLKDRMDFVTALVGKPGNTIQKKVISQFSK